MGVEAWTPGYKTMPPRPPPPVQLRLIAFTVILTILFPLLLILILPSLVRPLMIVDFSRNSVESLTEDQLSSLKNLKFVDGPSTDSNSITRDRLPKESRVIPKGSVVTMDWDPNRLNLYLDEEGKVYKVKKG